MLALARQKLSTRWKKVMKLIILLGLTLVLKSAYAAPPLFCGSRGMTDVPSSHILVAGRYETNCLIAHFDPSDPGVARSSGHYNVSIEGFGPGMDASLVNIGLINCPLVHKSKLTKSPFYGIDAEVDALAVGVNVGVFVNKNLGVCFVTGLDFIGLGVSLKGAKLTFR
jgi:hypothetical protein